MQRGLTIYIPYNSNNRSEEDATLAKVPQRGLVNDVALCEHEVKVD